MAIAARPRAAELLERDEPLACLRNAYAEARQGRGGLVFVGGEAGGGKTALAQRFSDEVDSDVLWGRCDPLVTPPPLGPLLEVATTARDLTAAVETDARPHLIAEALLDMPRGRTPFVVVLEDLHWADEATLDVLRVLGRRVGTSSTLVVGTYRDDELDRTHPLRIVLGELATTGGVTRLVVEPLSRDAVLQLAAGRIDGAELHRLTSGNPFYVTEVLAAGVGDIPATVRDAVLARIAPLSASATAVVEAASVAPPMLDAALTLAVCGDASDSVDECLVTGVLVAVDGGVAFRHELARLAVEETLSPTRRLALHRAVLLALTDRAHGAADLARIAHHAEHAADVEAVLRYAPAAAAEATRLGAHREAAAQYARALRFCGSRSPEEQAPLLELRSDALYLTDDQVAAIADLEAAVEFHRWAGALDREAAARGRLVDYLTCRGRLAEAEEAAAQSIAVLGELPDSPLLTEATAAMALVSAYRGDDEAVVAWGKRTLQLARRFGDTEKRVDASITLASVELFARGDSAPLEEALAEARKQRLPQLAARAMCLLALGWLGRGSHESAERWIDDGLAHCDGLELDLWRLALLSLRVRMELDRGSWTEATSTAETILAEIRDSPEPRLQALLVLALVRARRGDPDTGPLLDEADRIAADATDPGFHAPLACARAEIAWLERRPDRARDATDEVWRVQSAAPSSWWIAELAYWRCKNGIDEELPGTVTEPWLLHLAGDWRAAADAWRARDRPYETALALSEADDEDALRDSLAELQRLGAGPLARMVARRLRERGVRGVARGPRRSTAANAAHLTDRQVDVLRLLADGLRNADIADRLFLSRRTVDHHVSAILRALDVRSRGEAVAAAARLGLLQDR
jgi:DNA-binding CsgD family transcriptional regulator/tetratricopeptide (TPR) repeat protein